MQLDRIEAAQDANEWPPEQIEAIRDLKARRDHAVDRKDWATYAALHTDDFVGTAIPNQKAAGGKAIGISGKDGQLIEARKLRRTTRETTRVKDPATVCSRR